MAAQHAELARLVADAAQRCGAQRVVGVAYWPDGQTLAFRAPACGCPPERNCYLRALVHASCQLHAMVEEDDGRIPMRLMPADENEPYPCSEGT